MVWILKQRLLLCLIAFSLTVKGGFSASNEIHLLTWPDLIPPQVAFEDPFSSLTKLQRYRLALLARMRESIAREENVHQSRIDRANALESELSAEGLNVKSLLLQHAEITARRQASAMSVVQSLDSQNVRIAGYLLPLEYDQVKVTEFLLVPYVGACIHAPPPPPNQIVYVRFSAGYKLPSLFSPVWVQGQMRVDHSERELFLVDGSADIPVGYHLVASLVETYGK
jgi:hypothetical protein